MSVKLPLSLVVITFNEESNIERCLSSVPFASEIIVLDSFSTDRTKEIAERRGAKVYQESWKGYGPQKSSATQKASFDWILSLDADEELGTELAQEIMERFQQLSSEVGYLMPRCSFHLGRWIGYGGWYPDYQLRLFHRKYSSWTAQGIHERVLSPQTSKLKNPIFHYVFKNLEHQIATNNRYSTLQATELNRTEKKFFLYHLVSKPVVKFVELYFFKRGFLDGIPGFIIAVGGAYSVFLKFAKLWELQHVESTTGEKNNHK